jgi:hypothetical protein
LVASCKISESNTTQGIRIKIQTNIVPSLHRLRPDRQIFPHPRQSGKRISLSRGNGYPIGGTAKRWWITGEGAYC